jgi:ribonuclease BN (tRNA processing enzyme)
MTHVHGDHVFGLEDFAFMRYYENHSGVEPVTRGGPRPKFIAHSAVEAEVWETLAASLRYLADGDNPRSGTLDHYFEVVRAVDFEAPRENPWRHAERFQTAGIQLVTRESEHVPGKPSCSLEISLNEDPDDDRIAWWSGDCTVDQPFLESIEPRTSVYFHDCTFTDYPGQVHGSFALLEKLPEAIRLKMVLMHHEDNIEENRARAEALGFRLAFPDQVWNLDTGKLTE